MGFIRVFGLGVWGSGFGVEGFRGLGFHRNCIGFGSRVLSESFERMFLAQVLFFTFDLAEDIGIGLGSLPTHVLKIRN